MRVCKLEPGDNMKKAFLIVIMIMGLILILNSCATLFGERTGTLPKKWWTKEEVGEIENYYRDRATGVEQSVKLFIAQSDSALNIDRSTAIENARLDAAIQLSRYLAMKVTGVKQNSAHTTVLQNALAEGKLTEEHANDIQRKVEEKLSAFSASVTNTQFSSFKEIGQHAEQDGNKYIGWVCYSMSDQILEETRQLQSEAFKSLILNTKKYEKIMQEIQEVIAESMKEAIMEETRL